MRDRELTTTDDGQIVRALSAGQAKHNGYLLRALNEGQAVCSDGEFAGSTYVRESPFATAVREELKRARDGHGPQRNLHESWAVIMEEVDELWDMVRLKAEARDPGAVLKELVQIGAMCQRAAEDLGLILSR